MGFKDARTVSCKSTRMVSTFLLTRESKEAGFCKEFLCNVMTTKKACLISQKWSNLLSHLMGDNKKWMQKD
eukprot:scaffold8628_cov149-Amphora_coffeaeformis.AAC.8